jgi:glycosyltransferase involved in cell wall biosynthesis
MMPRGSTSPDISLIITAHDEGRLVHKSLRSGRRAVRHAREQGISTEIIAVLDCPSPETCAYFEEYGDDFDLVCKVELRDTGLSRNRGAQLASGRYLAFMDADGLFSENWLTAAFRLAEADGSAAKLVLHPELNLCFGRELYLVSSFDSDIPDYSPLELMEFNPWSALSFVPRFFFLDGNQYAGTRGSVFRHHDWHWNCEVVAGGARHRLVPRTVHFTRLRTDVREQLREESTFRPSTLFALPAQAGKPIDSNRPTPTMEPDPLFLRKARSAAIKFTTAQPDLVRFGRELRRAVRTYRASFARPPLDRSWLTEEWRRMHEIEPDLFPSRLVVKGLEERPVPRSAVASRYPELYDLIEPCPTHLYLLPFLKRGGADIVSIQFMEAALRESPGSNVTCVTTEDTDSEWLRKLPGEIRVIEFGKILRDFSASEKAVLLLRLLLQKKPRVIHNINSALGYKLFTENGSALAAESSLFVSLFGVEFMPEGRLGGYAIWDLPHCIGQLSGVLTDSQSFANRLCDTYGFERAKFSVLYVPAPDVTVSRTPGPKNGVLDVLWASRIDTEKRPDVLCRIATALADLPIRFHVYGSQVFNSVGQEVIGKLKGLPNVTTYGTYDAFNFIPVENYDVFLYTSERDGLPNVLLEAIAAGLPVIAPDVGGIKELIHDGTGFLVSGAEAVDEYVAFLKSILSDYRIVVPKVESARTLIETRHSWASFVSCLRRLPGYIQ